ncbi:hypothetical protein ACFYOT_30290 [Saccharothrix saharensis]|uniref:hypothetical protein n=1 Tax=Saccharothrix saharensis TaxID=571190 RepID=UPI0036B674D5
MSSTYQELFSHPDTDRPDDVGVVRRDEQRSYTDLFREPAEVPSQSTGGTS